MFKNLMSFWKGKDFLTEVLEEFKEMLKLIEKYQISLLFGVPAFYRIIIKHILEKHSEKIQIPYLTFLIDIVSNYFKVNVPKIDGVTNLLGFL